MELMQFGRLSFTWVKIVIEPLGQISTYSYITTIYTYITIATIYR